MLKRKLIHISWCLLGLSMIVLLAAAMQKNNYKKCTDVKIEIEGNKDYVSIDEKELVELLNENENVRQKELGAINLRSLEARLEQDPWIEKADLFFDNQAILQVYIKEREPIARIFSIQGNSFYIDSSGFRLPLIAKAVFRVPVFTSFSSGSSEQLPDADSSILQDVKKIAKYINSDSFWLAQIAQIDITLDKKYELVPVIGNQIIRFGNADNIERKFKRLFSFYENIWAKQYLEKYSIIDVQYDAQVVAIKRGAIVPNVDSATYRLDSAALSTINKPVWIEKDSTIADNKIKASVKNKKAIKKQEIKNGKTSNTSTGKHPKAVMPKDH